MFLANLEFLEKFGLPMWTDSNTYISNLFLKVMFL